MPCNFFRITPNDRYNAPACRGVHLSALKLMQVNANTEVEANTNTVEAVYGHDPSWQTVIDWPDYQINVQYPYDIRVRDTGRVISRWINSSTGYWEVALNGKKCKLHRIIAKQFIPNDDPLHKNCVDHIDRDKTNFHITNLRWVSVKHNSNNRSDQNFVEDISPDAIAVESYSRWEFEGLYFHDDVFYMYNGINYVIKPRFQNKAGNYCIQATDSEGILRAISYIQFKKEYDLI